ncbi:coiled-coil domain-containing protein 89 isoform X1 [Takifugu rubripes]|uniref:coiled-coil domain-containing protein 89 isoform X1 n=1 Tax=Takifugu rubripes TaxID=31033 RepID=UPI001145E66F|nr:coiled-coil domain-containing protein 89 isoform X1 [Takifugu rubripes]
MNQCVSGTLASGETLHCLSVDNAGENPQLETNPPTDLIPHGPEDEPHGSLQIAIVDLECQLRYTQKELESEKKRTQTCKERFMELAKNHRAIILFMHEYKKQNVQLKVENKELQLENKTLFSKKVEEKEAIIQKLLEENEQLREQYTNKEKEYQENIAHSQSKAEEQANEHQAKEAGLLAHLESAQNEQRNAVHKCKELELKLRNMEEEHVVKEANLRETVTHLTKDNGRLSNLSVERMQMIQEKDKEIQKLGKKWKYEKECRMQAEERFQTEAEEVNVNDKVMSLQAALNESTVKYATFQKDFEAFREHSNKLLTQERELNKTLRHLAL